MEGTEAARWNWGRLHTATFKNQSLGNSGIAPIDALFDRGPFPTGGSDAIINATGWNPNKGYAVDWLPSMRMIVDLGNLSNSVTVHTTGQSGHAYAPHYIDMADMWRNIHYYPMLWEQADIIAGAKATLLFHP